MPEDMQTVFYILLCIHLYAIAYIHVWVLWNRMSNALRTVTDELGSCGGALAIDSLCVAALRNVVRILRGGKAKNVGPLLHLLGIC
jgi:DNA-binding transcriptional regulator of glucitol operon